MVEKGVAFLVGIDIYQQKELQTFNGEPTEDVRSLKNILDTKFSRYKVEPKSISWNGKITNKQLKEALKELFSEKNYKNVLIYFSGHGYQIKKPEVKTGYLATSDSILYFDTNNPNVIVGEQNGLSFYELSEIIAKAVHLNSIILLLDACHSGYAIQEDILKNSIQLKSGFNYCIIASSLSSQESFTSRGQSLFTKHLIAKLEDENSGQIKSEDLFSYINQKLNNEAQLQQSIRVLGGENSFILMDYPSTGLNVPTIKPILDENGEIVCPYRGLQYFDDDEIQQKFFFGRQADTQKIRNKLDNSSFVLVIGASGSGKSSVVRAGLIQKQLRQEEKDVWIILPIIKPGENPLDDLRDAFFELEKNFKPTDSIHDKIKNYRRSELPNIKDFNTILDELRNNQQMYLLVIDQFEEIFTLTVSAIQSQGEQDKAQEKTDQRIKERNSFIELVTKVAEVENSPLKVVVTMRADFLGSCLNYPTLKNLIDKDVNVCYIAPLVGSGLISAIKEPAARQGYPIEQDLENALIQDVKNEPGYLPLLEFTLEQLWKKKVDEPRPCIPLAAYKALDSESFIEDNNKKMSGLKQALNLHANNVYKYSDRYELEEQELEQQPKLKRSKEEQEWIRLIFLRLVRTGEGNTDTRQRQLYSSLLTIVKDRDAQRLNQVINSLVKGRLLVSDQSDPTSQDKLIDLAHEALIDGWQKFVTWREEDREIRRAAERLEDARQDWEKAEEKDKTQYLISRALLAQVREHWGRLKFYLKDPKGTGEFYRLSSKYEQAEKLELQLQVDANRVERLISARKPPVEILTLAIQTIGKNREQIPEKLVGSVPASLRQVVEKIFTASHPYGHTDAVNSVAFSPDGQTIVSGSRDKSVRLWNLDGTPKGNPLEKHTSYVKSVAFSPDGQTIVSGSWDNSVRLWNLYGTPKGNPLEGHTSYVNSVAFSPDGQTIVSGSEDKSVRLWKQTSWRCWLRTCLRRLGNNWTYDKEGIAARTRLFEEGYSLAEQNSIVPAITCLKQAFKCGKASLVLETDIDEALTLNDKLEASAKRLIAPIFIQQGQNLARSGDYDQALAKFKTAKQLNPDLTLDPVVEAERLTAPILRMQGTFAALEDKISEAIAKFKQAKQYNLDLGFEPEVEAKRIAALVSVGQGRKLAEDGAISEAIAKFEQAKQYGLNLEFESEAEAKRIAATACVKQGGTLVKNKQVREALEAYEKAKTYAPNLEISADNWNNLCWYGVLQAVIQKNTKLAKAVFAASQKALEAEPDNEIYRDTLGIAKVLAGTKRDWTSAIKDFEFYIEKKDTESKERKAQRQRWIDALKQKVNPFTEQELQSLLNE